MAHNYYASCEQQYCVHNFNKFEQIIVFLANNIISQNYYCNECSLHPISAVTLPCEIHARYSK